MHDPRFGALPPEYCQYALSRAAILPLPYETTTTYLKGTRFGPAAILDASPALEFYDEELDTEPFRVGIHTCRPLSFPREPAQESLRRIEDAVLRILDDGKFPVGVGGEHTVSVGLVRACAQRHEGLTVIQFDAHADLRDEYEGSPYNHACTMRRVLEICPVMGIGIRAMDMEEKRFAGERGLPLVLDWELQRDPGWLDRALAGVRGPVYVTVDMDAMDPALVPAVGTPEPGGFGWYGMLGALRKIFERFHVVGADLVELCPREGLESSSFIAAKLLYKVIAYRFYLDDPRAAARTV
jgi:agmatinase